MWHHLIAPQLLKILMTLPSAQMNVQILLFGKVRVRMRVRGEPEGGTKMNKVRAHFGAELQTEKY